MVCAEFVTCTGVYLLFVPCYLSFWYVNICLDLELLRANSVLCYFSKEVLSFITRDEISGKKKKADLASADLEPSLPGNDLLECNG